MNKDILVRNYYKIITNISLIYLENEELQKKYDEMLFDWINIQEIRINEADNTNRFCSGKITQKNRC